MTPYSNVFASVVELLVPSHGIVIYDLIFHRKMLESSVYPRLCTSSLLLPGAYVQNPPKIKYPGSDVGNV